MLGLGLTPSSPRTTTDNVADMSTRIATDIAADIAVDSAAGSAADNHGLCGENFPRTVPRTTVHFAENIVAASAA